MLAVETQNHVVDASGGTFQIRPHKDFAPLKGRDRLLSLHLLSELPPEFIAEQPYESESSNEPRNAYDFMKRRREAGGDPIMQRWNASIRLSNYATVEGASLCVSHFHKCLT